MLMTLGAAAKGVKLIFAHDTEIALAAAAALVNTGRDPDGDQLPATFQLLVVPVVFVKVLATISDLLMMTSAASKSRGLCGEKSDGVGEDTHGLSRPNVGHVKSGPATGGSMVPGVVAALP